MPMHCRHLAPLLLLLGLLLLVCGAATGVEAVDARQAPACDPATLAERIARSCFLRMRSAPCCEALLDTVNNCGGVPCLCIVSNDPAIFLNYLDSSGSVLLDAYAACGGLRAEGATCDAAAPPFKGKVVLLVIP